MNKLSKTKIDWCDEVWNPVWGCKRNCFFKCYAKGFHKRFAKKLGITNSFEVPTWIESNFQKRLPTKPKRIFVGSMSDIEYWQIGWMKKVLKKIKDYPQHIFLFLTKSPSVYKRFEFPKNCWFGLTVTGNIDTHKIDKLRMVETTNLRFISIEPLLSEINFNLLYADWIIVGGLTPKPVHKEHWVELIHTIARMHEIPLFLKENLHWSKTIQQFPKEMNL